MGGLKIRLSVACAAVLGCGGPLPAPPDKADDGADSTGTQAPDTTSEDHGSGAGTGGGTATPQALLFEGIETAAWDGADGLAGTWSDAMGMGTVVYELVVQHRETGGVTSMTVAGTEATITGLPDGEYELRVVAIDDAGQTNDGDRTLFQVVGQNRIAFRSEVQIEGISDVWGAGDVVVLAGWHSDLSLMVVDIADPLRPEVLTEVYDEGLVKDVKIGDGLLFASAECECKEDTPKWDAWDRIGVRIYEFSKPAEPLLLAEIGEPNQSVHNLFYAQDHLYITDNESDGVVVFSVADPTAPRKVSEWMPPGEGRVHDQAWVDDLLYVAYLSGFAIVDVSDPSDPIELLAHSWGEEVGDVMLHNIWPAGDGAHVLTTEERAGGGVKVWNIEGVEPVEVAEYVLSDERSTHNVHVRDQFAFVSYYWDGLRVLDIDDPADPKEIGWYDTLDEDTLNADPDNPLVGSLYDGTWGVWPYGEHIAISDVRRGLLLFEHMPQIVEASP